MRLTMMPRASRRQPIEAAARPLPSEDTTPPVTKMYFADMSATSLFDFLFCAWCARLSMAGFGDGGKWLIALWESVDSLRDGGANDVWNFEDGFGVALEGDVDHTPAPLLGGDGGFGEGGFLEGEEGVG